MKKILFIPIIILGLFVSGNVFAETSVLYPNDPIACTMEYAPVCGESQYQCPNPLHPEQPCATVVLPPTLKTYSNACAMRADGAKLVHQGVCGENEKPTFCTMEYAPVCGEKQVQCVKAPCYPIQKTYSNQCMMNADSATFVSTGECKQDIKKYSCPANMVDGGCGVNPKPSFCQVSKIKLQKGSRGKYVIELQESLKQLGVETDRTINLGKSDGIFGNKLSVALKYFQNYTGAKPDGIFGKSTKEIICGYPLVGISPMTIPSYTVEINRPKGPMVIGGTTSNMDIVINASNISEPKSVEMVIEYNTGIPNPQYYTSKRETKRITTSKLVNGSNTISDVMIGSVVSITIDGQSVPFTKNY